MEREAAMIQTEIRRLAEYGVRTGLVPKEDKIYTINRLLELFGLDELEEVSAEQAAEIEKRRRRIWRRFWEISWIMPVKRGSSRRTAWCTGIFWTPGS